MGNYRALKRAVASKIGENALYINEIENIVHNLGGHYARGTLWAYMKTYKLDLDSLGINFVDFGFFNSRINLYPESSVWSYLQELESKGKIQLRSRGVESFNEILERGYNYYPPITTVMKSKREKVSDETYSSFENAVKIIEDK